ncbi:Cytochrome c6 [bioreactor metagenome]|uniref:Cytochrome c6 n=1 Tax=bioreactor metagenome TaxID=1076179 RepID=A0A644YMM4_9ZZZZ
MSDTHADSHTGPIKNPKQLLVTVIAAFVIPVFIIIGLVFFVTAKDKPAPGSGNPEKALAERIQKVGSVEIRDANRPLRNGDEVYKVQCAACHATGTAGAPKFEDAAAWAPRLKQGLETLVQSALKGKNAMAPQGGGDFNDLEIARGVVYMANAAGGKFPIPEKPADGASAPEAAAAAAPVAAAEPAPAPAPASAAEPAPAAAVAPAAAPAAPATASADAAKALYDKTCFACHAAGVAGAPKFGDKAAWAKYLEQGMDTMVKTAISGKGAMPPKGGSTASDDEIRATVQYMVDHLK